MPRAGNDSGGGQLGNAIHCKPHGANDWLYVVVQEAVWDGARQAHRPRRGRAGSRDRSALSPRSASAARTRTLVWTLLNKFAEKYTKRELMAILNPLDVPCGPIMSTEDLANDEHVRGRDMWVELDHPQRGKWFNVGMPIKLSASPAKIERSPTAGRAHRRSAERSARATTRSQRGIAAPKKAARRVLQPAAVRRPLNDVTMHASRSK